MIDEDAAVLEQLGYRQELKRVLGLFDNFSVAFSYLSPMVGIYSLFAIGGGAGGPRYLWLMPIVVGFMVLVSLVFGELGSAFPISGALYQYGRRTVGPRYGWWVGWIYGIALLVTVASVDTGIVSYFCTLVNNLFGTSLDGTKHSTILVVTVVLVLVQGLLNAVGARIMGVAARYGVYVETIGTFGVAIALGAAGLYHRGFGFLFTTQGAQHLKTNPLQVDFGGHWWTSAALVAVLAHVYIFYGFESAGDIAEETVGATRTVPRAMRTSLLYGGIASFVLVGALLLAIPHGTKAYDSVMSLSGGPTAVLAQLPSWVQDLFLAVICVAFISCGTAVQGAGSRLAYSYARDNQIPGSRLIRQVSARFSTPIYAIAVAVVVPILFSLLVTINPSKNVHILWFDYPAQVNALTALVSFATSGIYLSFLLTVVGSMIARSRGWQPQGAFRLGRWAWPVSIVAALYLAAMFVNIVYPSALSSGRAALFNLGWITLAVMALILLVGLVYFVAAQPWRHVADPADTAGPGPLGAGIGGSHGVSAEPAV